jgi:hypothetical protein
VSQTLSIHGRFNGPLTSGHGGYCSGVIASFVEGQAEVTLRSPVPLETDGRKRHAGAAVLSSDGVPLAVAGALMIEPRKGPPE